MACICQCALAAWAQNHLLLRIRDESGEPIVGAWVKLKDGPSLTSDEKGEARVTVTAWPLQIELQAMGYYSLKQRFAEPAEVRELIMEKKVMELGEVVVTGLGRPTKVDEAVSLYRILTREDFRKQGAVTLNDVMRNQLGLNIGNDAALGATISMRGLSGSNVKILIDGLPINGRENGNIDMGQINMSNIERVEIVQGPMSIMYGSDALGGVINLITKSDQVSSSAGANFFYESIGKYNVGADAQVQLKSHSLYLNLGRNFFQGWDPLDKDKRNPLWRPKEHYLGNLKYTFKLSPDASITYALDVAREHLVIKGGMEDYSYLNTKTKDEDYYTDRITNRLIAQWKTGASGFWQSNNSMAIYNRRREAFITDLSTMDKTPSATLGDNSQTRFNDITSRTTYNNKVGILNYTFGYDLNVSMASGVDKIEGRNKNMGDFALFLTTDLKVSKALTLQPAIRGMYNTSYKAPWVPSMALLYKPDKIFSLRGSYARGFRAPSLKELYLNFKDNNHDILGNPDLKAEHGHHFQLSTGFAALQKENMGLTTSITGFYDDVNDQIALAIGNPDMGDPNQMPPYIYTNIGRTRFLSFQWLNDWQWRRLSLKAGMSLNNNLHTESRTANGLNTYVSPAFSYLEVNAQGVYDLPEAGMSLSVYYKYTGSQRRLGSDIMGNAIFGEKTQGYHNIDLSLDKRFWGSKCQLTVGVRNLFDVVRVNYVSGSDPGGGAHGSGYAGGMALSPGRSLFGTFSFRFAK